MKNIFNYFGIIAGVLFAFACSPEKELTTIVNESAANPPAIDKTIDGTSIILEKAMEAQEALMVKWGGVDYGVGVSLEYTVEMDVKGNEFASPRPLGHTTEKQLSLSHGDLNVAVLGMGFAPEKAVDFEIRVTSKLNNHSEVKTSEMVNVNLTPFSTIFPSIYMIGKTFGDWDPNLAVEVANTGTENEYETIAYFDNYENDAEADSYFRFFTAPDWGSSLGGVDVFTNVPEDLLQPQPGENSDKNFEFIGESGWYRIKANVNTATIEMEKVDEPLLYLTGDATHGWNWDSTTTINWVGHQIWEGDVTFNQDKHFRFFEQADWGPVGYGHNVLTEFDENFIVEELEHDDPNFKFVAATGMYHIKVDKRAGTIEISAK